MTYRVVYMDLHDRTMRGIIHDSRYVIPALANVDSFGLKIYCDGQISQVVTNVLPFKIETRNGNLAGYFTLNITGQGAGLLQKQLRPAFIPDDIAITSEIINFVSSNKWKNFYLF